MKKLMLLAAGAVGYVLGAKAGRQRYDQIAEQASKLMKNPKVQHTMDEAKHVAADTARSAAGTAAEKVKQHAPGSHGSQTGATQTPAGASANSFGRGDEDR